MSGQEFIHNTRDDKFVCFGLVALQILYQRYIFSFLSLSNLNKITIAKFFAKSKMGAETVASSRAVLFISVDGPPAPSFSPALMRKHQMLEMLKWERYLRD